MKAILSPRHLLLFTLSWALFAGVGACQSKDAGDKHKVASRGDGIGLASESAEAVSGRLAEENEDEDGERKDYWKDIKFDRHNFDEIRQMVEGRYIDPGYDRVWAWAQAAAFAASSNEDRPLTLLPEAFYKARVDDPDEKGRLKGKMFKMDPADPFVLLEKPEKKDDDEEDKEEKRRLSDEEIRELRDKAASRTRALHQAWDDIEFGKKEFDRLVIFLMKEFKGAEKWQPKDIWISAAQGYLYSLDPHSALIPKVSWDEANRKTQDSSFEGIGAILTQRPDTDYITVESPISGQPAVKAGVRAGDTIVAVDGKDIKGEPLSKVVSRIRGPSGSKVVLTLEREGEPEPQDVGIVRAKIDMKNVQGKMVDGYEGIGTVKVNGFVRTTIDGVPRTTDQDLAAEIARLASMSPGGKLKGLILDLRNNSGGLLSEGIKMADRFLKSGTIVSVKNRNSAEDETYRSVAGMTWDFPVIVLVNDGTASAAEIVASALQDNKRALVVGDRTFGKASVQTLFSPTFQDDFYIKLTVARYYGPSGRTLQVTGVYPDVTIPPDYEGKMPLGFREENLSGHLIPLDGEYESPNLSWVKAAEACVKTKGKAEGLYKADPNPAIKFDWQLMAAADLLICEPAGVAAR